VRNIFLFIRRYFNFLVFLVLQILAITFLVKYNPKHPSFEAKYGGIANDITGRINLQYNKIQYYFHLKETNRQLAEENARLKNKLGVNFEGPDSLKQVIVDSLVQDTWPPSKIPVAAS
jgi:rod shape-determining protein MreC